MDILDIILQAAIDKNATDIHLAPNYKPVFRIRKQLIPDEMMIEMNKGILEDILYYFFGSNTKLKEIFEKNKKLDFAHSYNGYRFRINVSLTRSVPTFSIRAIPNGEIDLEANGISDLVKKIRKINSGLILITGKVNSGKSITMNAFIQEVNKAEYKKIVTIEDPIEYIHKPIKSVVVQKEVGIEGDVPTFEEALINVLREDSDIAVIGEIRDKDTMNVALDLAESGGLVIGTLHTRSCGETIDRIINMYDPSDQLAIKNSLSSVIKLVISQKLLVGKTGDLVLAPEVMCVTNTIAAQIRQEKFSIPEIEDSIHTSRYAGSQSFETVLAELYVNDIIDMETIKGVMDTDRLEVIKGLILNSGKLISDK